MKRHNHHRLIADVKALIDDLETARILLTAVYAQWKRSATLTPRLVADVSLFVTRSERVRS